MDNDVYRRARCGKLHFDLIDDTYQPDQDKRWVVVAPPQSNGTSIVLARARALETFVKNWEKSSESTNFRVNYFPKSLENTYI
jgi:hypothetical protein